MCNHEHPHSQHGARMSEHGSGPAHAMTATYLRIAAILVMITLIEVGVFYVPTFQSLLVPILVLFLALNGPLHNLSDSYLFSAHMVQHLVLTLVFPPLLLYGTPAHVVRPLLRPKWVMAAARVATRPLAAGVIFSVPITIWHVPALYEAALRNHNLHILQHLVFLATGTL